MIVAWLAVPVIAVAVCAWVEARRTPPHRSDPMFVSRRCLDRLNELDPPRPESPKRG